MMKQDCVFKKLSRLSDFLQRSLTQYETLVLSHICDWLLQQRQYFHPTPAAPRALNPPTAPRLIQLPFTKFYCSSSKPSSTGLRLPHTCRNTPIIESTKKRKLLLHGIVWLFAAKWNRERISQNWGVWSDCGGKSAFSFAKLADRPTLYFIGVTDH